MPRGAAVVGAGILGMAGARFLQRDGHDPGIALAPYRAERWNGG